MLATLWVITAAIPAIVVWAVMRNQARIDRPAQAHAAIAADVRQTPPVARPLAEPEAAQKPAAAASLSAPVASVTETKPSAPAADSASVATSTVPVVVETESQDRVSVLVKSKPRTAKVYKRGKEIGRTPLIIQIGRGEHRIFEVGVNLGLTRRISIDGEKPEITVPLLSDPKPAPSAAPPPSE